ncbi:MAG: RNA 2',3'-cyclic phosphodiesterase [Nanoarchaeota archaeon]
MRLFIAILLPEEIKKYIIELQTKFSYEDIRFVEKDQLHITLKFLGGTNENIKEKLRKVKANPFDLNLTHLGVFPTKNNPRVLWAGTSNECFQLVDNIHKTVNPRSLNDQFHSHITIGRIKKIKDPKKFNKLLTTDIKKIKFKVDEFCLIESKLNLDGAKYKLIERYKLG